MYSQNLHRKDIAALRISFPTVNRTSLGGIQPNIEPVLKSGVITAWFHWSGVGRSTCIPRFSNKFAKWSSWRFAFSTVSNGLGPHIPRMSLSSGTLASVAGSEGGMQVWSARPTITCFSGEKSSQDSTRVLNPSIFVTPWLIELMKPKNWMLIRQGTI